MLSKLFSFLFKQIKAKVRNVFNIENISIHQVRLNLKHENITDDLKTVFYNESYEADEIALLKKYLNSDDIVLEIGAGIGFLSTYCAKIIGDERVFAYEANPFMMDKIRETYRMNGVSPEINNVLLCSSRDETTFFLDKNFWSSSTIKRNEGNVEVQVSTKNINDELAAKKANFLIIDIEGGEKELIPLIDFEQHNIQKLIIEIHPHLIGATEASAIIGLLISKSFTLNLIDSKGIVLMFERQK